MDDINKVEKNGKLDVSAKSLMTCEIINSIIDLFLNTFLVAYLLWYRLCSNRDLHVYNRIFFEKV